MLMHCALLELSLPCNGKPNDNDDHEQSQEHQSNECKVGSCCTKCLAVGGCKVPDQTILQSGTILCISLWWEWGEVWELGEAHFLDIEEEESGCQNDDRREGSEDKAQPANQRAEEH